MKFTIVERKIKIEDELRQYALRKVEKLDRYFQQDSDTTLTFSELRGKQTVEITVRQVGLVVRAEETTTDMYASVDGAISSIERQIRKHKTRLEKRLREGAFDKMAEQKAALTEEDFDVVRRKRFDVKPMSVDDGRAGICEVIDGIGRDGNTVKNRADDNLHQKKQKICDDTDGTRHAAAFVAHGRILGIFMIADKDSQNEIGHNENLLLVSG